MSGGSYDYLYCKVEDMADRIGKFSNTPERKRFSEHLRRVAKAMYAIEWVDSCDWGKGDENAAIRAVFDPAENVAIDIAAAESRMIEAHRRARDLSDMEDNALDQRLRSRLGMAMTRAYAETSRLGEEWLALVEARDAKGGGA